MLETAIPLNVSWGNIEEVRKTCPEKEETMVVQQKMIVVFTVFAIINLCLAKPRWVWLSDESTVEKETFQNGDESNVEKETLQDSNEKKDKFRTATCIHADKRMCGRP